MINLKQAFEFLRDNKYIMVLKGKYTFTPKFYHDKGTMKDTQPVFDMVKVDQQLAVTNSLQMLFLDFIVLAKVPRRLEGSRGEMYDTNKYSEAAAKEFDKMMKSGVDIHLLTKATQLYYASGTGFKKKIGNYIIDGDWRSDYKELQAAAEGGEQSLKAHITEELDNGEHTPVIF